MIIIWRIQIIEIQYEMCFTIIGFISPVTDKFPEIESLSIVKLYERLSHCFILNIAGS